jgi:hypothetical protein
MATSFASDIKPLFTALDREHMMGSFDLWDYDDVKANASGIYNTVEDGSMPPSGSGEPRWSPDMVARFKSWMDEGYPA